MGSIVIKKIDKGDVNKHIIEQLAKVITYNEPENLESSIKWWNQWFMDKILGEKITVIAEEKKHIIGVVRFWKTPYCNDKWLIEGLEVIEPKRKNGVGRAMVNHGLALLRELTDENIFVNISKNNVPSIRLHESIGFKKISNGSINSLGDYREHIDQYVFENFYIQGERDVNKMGN